MPALPATIYQTKAVALLESRLKPAGEAEIREAVVRMLGGFPSASSRDEQAAEATIRLYVAALSGLPLWAITGAGMSFIRGTVSGHNLAFAPTAPQWAAEARKQTDPVHTELRFERARAEPPPREIPAEERAAVQAGIADLVAKLNAAEPAATPRHRLTLDDELAMCCETPIEVSARFAALIAEQSATSETERQRRAIIAASQTKRPK